MRYDLQALEELNAITAGFGPSDDGKFYRLGAALPPIDQTKAIVLITHILNELMSRD